MDSTFDQTFRLFPQQASTSAAEVDHLFYYVLIVSVVFTLLILVLVMYFSVRYRRKSAEEFPALDVQNTKLEITWCVVPFVLMVVMWIWGANLYARIKRPLDNAVEINVIGKQWMWKVQHPQGAREINELHVPVGLPIKLMMASQDVIHSFSIPAFRIKQDVVPGSFSSQWFVATKPGRYRIFCSQYCGTEHSRMTGFVVAMEPDEYQSWLAGIPPANHRRQRGQGSLPVGAAMPAMANALRPWPGSTWVRCIWITEAS